MLTGGNQAFNVPGALSESGGGGLLSSVGQWAGNNPLLASTAVNTGGQMIQGYAQGAAAEEQREARERREDELRNQRSIYGVRYDERGNPQGTDMSRLQQLAESYPGSGSIADRRRQGLLRTT